MRVMAQMAMVMNLGSYWFSDRIVLSMYRARELARLQPADPGAACRTASPSNKTSSPQAVRADESVPLRAADRVETPPSRAASRGARSG